tara:strand:+ start:143 stop:478 length:336 start_codon:yes stop_codon:yes gene_type:complete
MTPLEAAEKYIDIFYSGKSLDGLVQLLDPACTFEGPLFKFSSAAAYINSLRESPPAGMEIEVIDRYSSGCSACIVYRFNKGDISTLMSQRFVVKNGWVVSIQLIFDSACFA